MIKLTLKHDYFDFNSDLHGYNHTKRVMILVKELGKYLPYKREVELAYCAAFIHDMARTSDGLCYIHGERSSKLKLPLFKQLFLDNGISENEIDEISFAVLNHSLPIEVNKKHQYYITTAILKDADALDRVRLGDLDPNYLRFDKSVGLIPFATDLLYIY